MSIEPLPDYGDQPSHQILRDSFMMRWLGTCATKALKYLSAGFDKDSDPSLVGLTYYAKKVEEIRLLTKNHPFKPWGQQRVKGQILQVAPLSLYGVDVRLGCFTGKVEGYSVLTNPRGIATESAIGKNCDSIQWAIDFDELPDIQDSVLTYYLVSATPRFPASGADPVPSSAYLVLPTGIHSLSRDEAIKREKPFLVECKIVHRLDNGEAGPSAQADLTPTGDSPIISTKKRG